MKSARLLLLDVAIGRRRGVGEAGMVVEEEGE
jgi:hypothetical protein